MKQIKMAAARVDAGLTQEDIAKRMGVSKTTIVFWEKGKVIPGPAQFEMFCRICGFDTNDIFLPTKLT